MPAIEEDRIIIFGWDAPQKKIGSAKSFGHVSLKTSEDYHSFWPKFKQTHMLFKKEPYEFKKTLAQDIVAEERDPDWAVCLYTLNSELIEEKAIEMKANVNSWCPNGTENDESCASFVYQMLDYAGIDNLYQLSGFSHKAGSSMTPGEVKALAYHAKIKEYDEVAPETQAFSYNRETSINDIRAATKSTCCIL